MKLGAKAPSPYGDLFHRIYQFVQNVVLQTDPETGLSDFANEFLVDPLTQPQSGVSGTFVFGSLLDVSHRLELGGLSADVSLEARNVRIEGLDTLGAPLSAFEPVLDEANHLNNTASLGVATQPLRVAARILFAFIFFGKC